MRRCPDAETRLMAWARARLGKPLVYGATDCMVLAFEAVGAMAGSDIAEAWRGLWGSDADGIRYMLKQGTHIVRELELAGLHAVSPGFQQPGDIVVAEAMEDANAAEKRLRRRLGIGFMRAHVCLGMHCLSASPDAGVHLMHAHAIINEAGYIMHIMRVPA